MTFYRRSFTFPSTWTLLLLRLAKICEIGKVCEMQIYAWKKVGNKWQLKLHWKKYSSHGWLLNVGKVKYYNVMQSNILPTQNILLEKKKS